MLEKLGQIYQQKFFRSEQLSPPLKRFRVYPQTLDEIDLENEIFLHFKTATEEQCGGWFSTGMVGPILVLSLTPFFIIFNQHLDIIEKLRASPAPFVIIPLIVGLPGTMEVLKPLPAPWRFNRRTREV